jgi:hypothetical protein
MWRLNGQSSTHEIWMEEEISRERKISFVSRSRFLLNLNLWDYFGKILKVGTTWRFFFVNIFIVDLRIFYKTFIKSKIEPHTRKFNVPSLFKSLTQFQFPCHFPQTRQNSFTAIYTISSQPAEDDFPLLRVNVFFYNFLLSNGVSRLMDLNGFFVYTLEPLKCYEVENLLENWLNLWVICGGGKSSWKKY